MKQQINFLDSLPKLEKPYLTFASVKKVVFGWLLLLIVIYFAYFMINRNVTASISKYTAQKEALQSELATMAKLAAGAPVDAKLKDEVANLDKIIASKQHLLSLLQKQQTVKLGAYLTDIAHAAPEGLWLTDIEVQPNTGYVLLKGRSTDGSLVPVFVNQLKKTSLLQNEDFQIVNVTRNSDKFIDFEIKTKPLEADKK